MADEAVTSFTTMARSTGLQSSILHMHPPIIQKFKSNVESMMLLEALSNKRQTASSHPLYHKVVPEASKLRNRGNEEYRSKNYVEALGFYTSSIATAPTISEELSLAFGNRSGVHLIHEKYDLCLLDINRALSGQLPESSKEALLKRKQKCLDQLRTANEIKLKLKKAIKNGEKRALYPTERSWLYAHQMSKNETDYKIDYGNLDDPIWNTTSFTDTLIPGLSPKVECAHSAEYGRHLLAADDINPGEVISIQEIFALVTSYGAKFQSCSYCTIWCDALIPCLTCTLVMYCSEACRTKANDLYHRIECKVITSSLFDPGKTKAWLALRMFLTGTKQGSNLKKLMWDSNVYDILGGRKGNVALQYPTNDYYAVLSMTWNLDKTTTPAQTGRDCLLKESETFDDLMYLFKLLQNMNFFNVEKPSQNIRSIADVELFAGLLLLHHLVVTKRYNFNLYIDSITDPAYFTRADRREVGRGTMTLQGFMNHSCDANTMNVVNRRSAMIFSSRLIKKGEQIFTTFDGHNYRLEPRVLRQMSLEHKFDNTCSCKACIENWSAEEVLVKKNNKYLTKDKVIIQRIEKSHEWFNEAIFAEDPPYKYKNGDLDKVLRFNKDIRQYVEEPSGTIALCESLIQKFMEKKGNCYVIQKLPSTLEPN